MSPEQLTLLAPAPAGVMTRDGWIGRSLAGIRRDCWTHPAHPGVAIRHCGHPTALRPYYVEGLPFARKFDELEHAKQAVLTGKEWP